MTCECGSWVSHQNGALRAPWGKEPYPPAAGGAMVRCAPQEGWDSVLPKESRPSLSCGLSASTWSLSSFQWTDFPDSFNPLSNHASEFRGFRDGEIRRRAKCAHGRHGGVGHACCIDCPWSADVSCGCSLSVSCPIALRFLARDSLARKSSSGGGKTSWFRGPSSV